jgi:hypothetical protein
MTRDEHLAFAKERALAYLPDITNALSSFVSDMGKHEELQDHAVLGLIAMHIAAGLLDERNVRDLIEGTR